MSRVSHPAQLDTVMYVIRPKGWLALAALFCFVGLTLIWSVVGTIPVTVTGKGILFSPGGILEVVSSSQGRLSSYEVRVGDRVAQGQVVATIIQPELAQQLDDAKRERKILVFEKEKTVDFQKRFLKSQEKVNAKRRSGLQSSLAQYREQVSWLEEQRRNFEYLWNKQAITKKQLLENRVKISEAQQSMTKVMDELGRIDMEEEEERIKAEKDLLDIEEKLKSANIKIEAFEAGLKRETQVYSPYNGNVVEIFVNEGEVVRQGAALFSVIPQNPDGPAAGVQLEAIIYIASADGKKVQEGMLAQIIPVIIKRTEYGGMLGHVRTVADIPASVEGMLHTLKNKTLVDNFTGGAPPYEVRVNLLADNGNPTGYRWTSRAPGMTISPGTLCDADITVKRIHPITLLIPALKPWLPDKIPER